MSNGAEVVLDRVSKCFGSFKALVDVSLKVNSGEFVTLLGPSGSGKSTTLMIIAGFERATSGEVFIDNQKVTDIPAHKRGLGMVFQSYSLFPHMTVNENIAFPLTMRKIAKKEISSRVADALSLVELPGFGERYPKQLSGGQQQRVALARALVFNPRVLLMDEPLGALDKNLRSHMQIEIKNIQKALGITVIFVTHDQEEAMTMSDKIVVMDTGKIMQIGSPQYIYDFPESRYVANFLGDSNFFDAMVEQVKDTSVILKLRDGVYHESYDVRFKSKLKPNMKVTLSVRPERLKLSNVGGIEKGKVMDKIFTGTANKYYIRLENGKNVIAVEQNYVTGGAWNIGSDIFVNWLQDDSRVLL